MFTDGLNSDLQELRGELQRQRSIWFANTANVERLLLVGPDVLVLTQLLDPVTVCSHSMEYSLVICGIDSLYMYLAAVPVFRPCVSTPPFDGSILFAFSPSHD